LRLLLHIFILLFPIIALAQGKTTKIELLGANSLEYDVRLGNNAKRLIGDVRFKHEGVLMNCDSAYLYSENNSLDAFGNVYINQGDTVHLYGDILKYYGNSRKAEVLRNVRLIDNDMTLASNNLTYDMKKDLGYYTGGGTMISKQNDTLISKIGYYYAKPKEFFFKDDVVLINPEYRIDSDTLKFNTVTEIAYFFGPTFIRSKENLIYCENGWYDTKKDISQFRRNAYLETKEQKLQGDSLYYDRKLGIGKAFKNVIITDTINKYIINGDHAIHLEKEDKSTIVGRPMMTMIMENDSLFLHADTLYAEMDSLKEHRIIHAYHHSKFFKDDMQGSCDSLVYSMQDSLIRMFKMPILWSLENQMTAEFIKIKTADGKVGHMYMETNGFIISQEDSLKYNQIKGKNILATFMDNKIYRIDADGDGETIYFTREDDGTIFGMNHAKSKKLLIYVKENAIQSISFVGKPDANMFPIEEVENSQLQLKDFKWLDEFRPKSKEDIFKRISVKIPEPEKPQGKKRKPL
jgi:lipopolysaccharide export system protein LptA